jgi:hypothetical protein
LFIFLIANICGQELLISEFLALNRSGLADSDGDRSDWVEIHNPSGEPVELEGWYLTDDPENLKKWPFPGGVISGQSFMLVFASGKDRIVLLDDGNEEVHTNFSLNRDGEFLALVEPDGETVSDDYSPVYPVQEGDVSFGINMAFETNELLPWNSAARFFVPGGNEIEGEWTALAFDDSNWTEATMGIGYSIPESSDLEPEPEEPTEIFIGDVTSVDDDIEPTSQNSPGVEGVENAIDNNDQTKYLNFDTLNSGFTLALSSGATVVTGLRLTSANDAPNRDPVRYSIAGSNDGVSFSSISDGDIPNFTERFETVEIRFNNDIDYSHYRLLFPTVRDPRAAVAMQIAEVELIGEIRDAPVSGPDQGMEAISSSDDFIQGTSGNSPAGEEVWNAIDDDPQTKYLNFDGINSGFTIVPALGESVVSGLNLTSANDAPDRDPTRFLLEGSNDGISFERIVEKAIPPFGNRFTEVGVRFLNDGVFTSYRLLFTGLSGAGSIMQIGDVTFLGSVGIPLGRRLDEIVQTNVESLMFEQQSSLLVRLPFSIEEDEIEGGLFLETLIDDGMVAFINGVEVVAFNNPDPLLIDSAALQDRRIEDSVKALRFGLGESRSLLQSGENVLAIHALNVSSSARDFLIQTRLFTSVSTLSERGYIVESTPGEPNTATLAGLVAAPEISVQSGFHDSAFSLDINTATPMATIRYTLDGSIPDETSGDLYLGPLSISRTTVLRARAFRGDWRPSKDRVRTWLFPDDIVHQNRESALAAGLPSSWRNRSADYGFDRRVIGQNRTDDFGGRYAESIKSDLTALPSISLVMGVEDLFGNQGIYSNPSGRGDAWERPVFAELVYPDGRQGFAERAGLRIQGGAFRTLSLKKSFRLSFREKYGATKLNYPLFGEDATDEFDGIVLRAGGNDAWRWGGRETLYVRDAFTMETARAMGMVSSHTTFVHLYLNGQYWGLYNMVERPDASFSASYHGENKETWDAINQDSTPDGTRDAWNRMLAVLNEGMESNEVYQRIQGNHPDGNRNMEFEDLLDMDNLINYMILNFYIGNNDWPGRNFWVGRNRDNGNGFQFYPWDSETSLGLGSGVNNDRTGQNTSVAEPYGKTRNNGLFKSKFADRVHKLFFNHGALYVNPGQPDWDSANPQNNRPAAGFKALANLIEKAVVAESARWGDQGGGTPFTRDEHWRPALNRLLRDYFPRRSAVVVDQFRRVGLYPRIVAPVFSHPGGHFESAIELTMSNAAGDVYFTLDGSDPMQASGSEESSERHSVGDLNLKRVFIPSELDSETLADGSWRRDLRFDDQLWASGSGGVGYDFNQTYHEYIGQDVESAMRSKNGSALIRIRFDYQNQLSEVFNTLILSMRYDDGFIAYLNGVSILSVNAPETVVWNSVATSTHDDSQAVLFEDFDVSEHLGLLKEGENLLAIHGLNISLASSDFLIDARLSLTERSLVSESSNSQIYTIPLNIDDFTTVKARTLSGNQWSAMNQSTFVVGPQKLVTTELHYHPAGSSQGELSAGFEGADEFEFIEFHNPGLTAFSLKGVRIIDGVTFDFTHSGMTHIPAGGFALVVSNPAAFELRYGSDLPVAGEYGGQFSNSGERVELIDEKNRTIDVFTYGVENPWPEETHGLGSSLEKRISELDSDLPENWRSSSVPGGTPGHVLNASGIRIDAISVDQGILKIQLDAISGHSYSLFVSDKIRDPEWTLLQESGVQKSSGLIDLQVEIQSDEPSKFFIVRDEVKSN